MFPSEGKSKNLTNLFSDSSTVPSLFFVLNLLISIDAESGREKRFFNVKGKLSIKKVDEKKYYPWIICRKQWEISK